MLSKHWQLQIQLLFLEGSESGARFPLCQQVEPSGTQGEAFSKKSIAFCPGLRDGLEAEQGGRVCSQ